MIRDILVRGVDENNFFGPIKAYLDDDEKFKKINKWLNEYDYSILLDDRGWDYDYNNYDKEYEI